jgi:hypothetical protein
VSDFLSGLSGAVFSHDRRYRYALWRRWDGGDLCAFVMLNPSTADEKQDDPSVRRCIGFARDWGFSGVVVGNIFALRSTDPSILQIDPYPIGTENDDWIGRIHVAAAQCVAAWGVHGALRQRGTLVRKSLSPLFHLGLTKNGHPVHPLYQPKRLTPQLWL